MPTTYTHYAFGQEVKNLLPDKIKEVIEPYEDYYNIGVHGPDILFYYHPFYKNRINQRGVQIHDRTMKDFLDLAFPVFAGQRRKKAAFAYLAGFMTHFILDSSCHPYVRERTEETGVSHAQMEKDWDSVMMLRDHLNPLKYHVTCHIHARPGYSSLIAPYFGLSSGEVRTSLIDMKLVLDHFFRSSFAITGWLASMCNKLFLRKFNYSDYFVKRSINPRNVDTIHHLDSLYQGCTKECAHMITALYHALTKDDRSFSEHKRFLRVFS